MRLHTFLTFSLSVITITLAQNESPPKMQLANQGWIEGKLLKTMGNLDNEPRTIYSYRNIPYADHDQFLRFQQSVPHTKELGTQAAPYNAGPTGPLCAQGGLDEQELSTLVTIPIQDTLAEVISQIPIPGLGLIADAISGQIIEALNMFFEIEIEETTTVGDLLEDWLDVKLAVSEECLHLAVYTPKSPSATVPELLPVMFFVHGGGFTSGFQLQMDAARLGEVADVIVVSINYRLGSLGFLCLDTDEGAGNMGMLDQVLALEWVHENIHLFGGDKDRITIFGESAGAASIGHLVMSKATYSEDGTGLFAQGIGQSGSATASWAFDTEPVYNSLAVAKNAGCDYPDNHTMIVECLRGRDVSNITSAFGQHQKAEMLRGKLGFGGTNPCGQTAGEKKFYTAFENPRDLLINGDYRHIPVFFGANSHEGSYVYTVVWDDYIVPLGLNNSVEYWSGPYMYDLLAILGIADSNVVAGLLEDMYFYDWQIGSQEDMTPGVVDFGGAFMLKAPGYQMVEENSRYNSSYFYQINHAIRKSLHYLMAGDTPYLRNADLGLPGTTHGDEMMYMFNVPLPIVLCPLDDFFSAMIGALQECQDSGQDALCFAYDNSTFKEEWSDCIWGEMKPEEQILSDRIVKAWTNFATYGSPTPTANDPDLPFMDKFDISNPSYLDFTHEGVIAVMDSFINALPYQKGGAANGEAEKCDCSGIGKVVPTASLLSLLSFLVLLLSR